MQELVETKREIQNHFYKQRLHNLRHRIRFVTDEGTEDEKGDIGPAPLPTRSPQVQQRNVNGLLPSDSQFFGRTAPRQSRIRLPPSLRGLSSKNILSNIASEKYIDKSHFSRQVSLVPGKFGRLIKEETTYLTQIHSPSASKLDQFDQVLQKHASNQAMAALVHDESAQ